MTEVKIGTCIEADDLHMSIAREFLRAMNGGISTIYEKHAVIGSTLLDSILIKALANIYISFSPTSEEKVMEALFYTKKYIEHEFFEREKIRP